MTDQSPIPEKVQRDLETGILADYQTVQEEIRRSAEIGNAFYEKLATLNAGSIAVTVSVGLAVLNKSDLHNLSHGLLSLISCFWISLSAAVTHNFLLLCGARLDAKYYENDFIKKMIDRCFAQVTLINPKVATAEVNQVKGYALEQISGEQQKPIARKRLFERVAKYLGYLSLGSFVLGYTLILIGAFRLWL